MSLNEKISVGHDTYTLVKEPSEASTLGYVFQFVISPRCHQYESHFVHDEHIRLFSLTGALEIELNGTAQRVEKEHFIDIRPGDRLRFRGLERGPVQGYIFSTSESVLRSWEEVAVAIQSRAVTGYGGQIHYR